ncbi:MAG: 1-deoxy-D-xylulose-5-phosphate reductoisomerase [Acidobacteriota bacterium]|nr:1-deoxy-D-xylulose-5-phosphate reductoisomerase [Acidobacteriota bacterium]
MSKRGISILGSTGSIGCNTLKVVEFLREPEFSVVALGAGRNVEVLARQILHFKPELVSVENEACGEKLLRKLHEIGATPPQKISFGESGLIEVATHAQADTVVSATVGAIGFVPTLRALEAGKRVALANKETLVIAGELMMKAARENRAEILPVDSEHNAIHQCLRGEKREEVRRIILTASGGPFRTKTKEEIENATIEEALNHPNWKMGVKNTIDSATLMNKGLEVIEAERLFGFGADEIAVVVHPQSVVHSMIEMVDGSVIAQMGVTDMRHAIQYALTFPERKSCQLEPLDFSKFSQLTFEEPDTERFPCLNLAYRALKIGGTLPAAMNAANEIAVQAFLDGKIRLSEIARIIETVMNRHETKAVENLEIILAVDRESRMLAEQEIEKQTVQQPEFV